MASIDRRLQELIREGETCGVSAGDVQEHVAYGGAVIPTMEQIRILRHVPEKGDVVLIRAFAGCGKTETLSMLAKSLLDKKGRDFGMAYLCFNNEVQKDAEERIGSIVDCFTIDALAVQKYVKRRSTCQEPHAEIPKLILQRFLTQRFAHLSAAVQATLDAYCLTTDIDISEKHIPDRVKVAERYRATVCEKVQEVLNAMYEDRTSMPVTTFSAARKFYHMETPDLGYDCIFLDEGQDLNPLMYDIVRSQLRDCFVVVVGDPKQRIYSFLSKNVDAFQCLESSEMFTLSTCFRFGPNIAAVANHVLHNFYVSPSEESVRVLDGRMDTVVTDLEDALPTIRLFQDADDTQDGRAHGNSQSQGQEASAEQGAIDRDNLFKENKIVRRLLGYESTKNEASTSRYSCATSTCYLCRTNAQVIECMDGMALENDDSQLHILGGANRLLGEASSYITMFLTRREAFEKTRDYAYRSGNMSKYTMMRYTERSLAAECEGSVPPGTLRARLQRIRKRCTARPHQADIVVGTVHQAKGREFIAVSLCDDFRFPDVFPGPCAYCGHRYNACTASGDNIVEILRRDPCVHTKEQLARISHNEWLDVLEEFWEEANLLYVAVTRPILVLRLPVYIVHMLQILFFMHRCVQPGSPPTGNEVCVQREGTGTSIPDGTGATQARGALLNVGVGGVEGNEHASIHTQPPFKKRRTVSRQM